MSDIPDGIIPTTEDEYIEDYPRHSPISANQFNAQQQLAGGLAGDSLKVRATLNKRDRLSRSLASGGSTLTVRKYKNIYDFGRAGRK